MTREMIRLTLGILLFALVPCLHAQDAEKEFKYGTRPADAIFDPAEILLPKERKEIAAPLAKILENEGIDMLVIVLPEIGDAPAKHVATGFSDAWAVAPVNAVVLYVPGAAGSPWIFPGEVINRVVVKPGKLDEWVSAGETRAAAESGNFGKIRAASVEAADIMRYCAGGAVLRTETIIDVRRAQQQAFEARRRLYKIALMVVLAGAIPLIAGAVFFLTKLRKTGSRKFPPIRKITRLGAPYAGGSNVVSHPKTY